MTKAGAELGEGVEKETANAPFLLGPFLLFGPLIAYLLIVFTSAFLRFLNGFDATFLLLTNLFFIAIPFSYVFGFIPAILTAVKIENMIEKNENKNIWHFSLIGSLYSGFFMSIFTLIVRYLCFGNDFIFHFEFLDTIGVLHLCFVGFFTTAILLHFTRGRQNKIAIAYGFEPPHKTI